MNKNIFLVSSPSQKKTAWLHSKLSFQRIFPPNLGSLSWWTPSFSKISLRLDHSLHFDLSDGWDRRWDRWENSASDVGDPEDSLPRWNRCVTSNFWGLFFENMPPESIRYMIRWSSLTLWHTCQCCPQRTNKKKNTLLGAKQLRDTETSSSNVFWLTFARSATAMGLKWLKQMKPNQ
jgi:hypothetical protein